MSRKRKLSSLSNLLWWQNFNSFWENEPFEEISQKMILHQEIWLVNAIDPGLSIKSADWSINYQGNELVPGTESDLSEAGKWASAQEIERFVGIKWADF